MKIEMTLEHIVRLVHHAFVIGNPLGARGILDDTVKELDRRAAEEKARAAEEEPRPAPATLPDGCPVCGENAECEHEISEGDQHE